jgi:hypothetical protein
LPDYVIYKNDTIPVYNLILESYLQKQNPNEDKLFGLSFRNSFDGLSASLNCWRGYQAIYKIENDSLFLTNIIDCHSIKNINKDESDNKLHLLFGNQVKSNKVFLNWYSGKFGLPNGKILRWDGVFYTNYENKILITVKNGIIKKISSIENYIDYPNRINRRYNDNISTIMFQKLAEFDWKNKKNFDCSEKYIITIGKNGKVKKVTMPDYRTKEEIKEFWDGNEYNYCIKTVHKRLHKLKFDILKKNGKPIEENIYLEIWVDDNGKLENWTN